MTAKIFLFTNVSFLLLGCMVTTAFYVPHTAPRQGRGYGVATSMGTTNQRSLSLILLAKKKSTKKSKGRSSGGFGSKTSTTNTLSVGPVPADKNSLEKQWDVFASVTDLEIRPLGNPTDEDYVDFKVVDVYVRCAKTETCEGTAWFRIGKVCSSDGTDTATALTLQRGLVLWTAVNMRRELAALGKAGAAALEVGYTSPAIVYMGSEDDGPLEVDEAELVRTAEKVSLSRDIRKDSFGFRPDWNPPGFTYKRREKAAMKKKRSALEEILESGE